MQCGGKGGGMDGSAKADMSCLTRTTGPKRRTEPWILSLLRGGWLMGGFRV